MNAQQTADAIYFNFIESEATQFAEAKEAIDTLIKYIETDDLLSLRSILNDVSERQDKILKQFD